MQDFKLVKFEDQIATCKLFSRYAYYEFEFVRNHEIRSQNYVFFFFHSLKNDFWQSMQFKFGTRHESRRKQSRPTSLLSLFLQFTGTSFNTTLSMFIEYIGVRLPCIGLTNILIKEKCSGPLLHYMWFLKCVLTKTYALDVEFISIQKKMKVRYSSEDKTRRNESVMRSSW